MIDTFTESLFLELEQFADLLPRLLFGILVIFLFYLIGKTLSRIYDRILQRTHLSDTNLQYFQRLIVGLSIFIGFVFFSILSDSGPLQPACWPGVDWLP